MLSQISKETIIQTMRDKRGVASDVIRELDIAEITFYKILNENPDLKEALEESRRYARETRVDEAEKTLDILLALVRESPTTAYKSATFILNNLGKDRGYNTDNSQLSNELLEDLKDKLTNAIGTPEMPKE